MKINKNCKKLKLIKKNCHARHAPESNIHQVEDFPGIRMLSYGTAILLLIIL
jgi:hypothetical protein